MRVLFVATGLVLLILLMPATVSALPPVGKVQFEIDVAGTHLRECDPPQPPVDNVIQQALHCVPENAIISG
jgi:hypothetical protein